MILSVQITIVLILMFNVLTCSLDQTGFEHAVFEADKLLFAPRDLISTLELEQDQLLANRRNLQAIDSTVGKSTKAKRVAGNTNPANYFNRSPSNGTDIVTHPIALIRCANQTLCIQPQLQLTKHYNVYYCKHVSHGVRFYFLIREALLLHPNLHMVDDMDAADVIVYLPESAVWHKTECAAPRVKSKTIVLDETDGPHIFEPSDTDHNVPWLLYFKRSCMDTNIFFSASL